MYNVSVVVPVKNEEASIAALLNGLLEQSHLPAEIIITDGGSTDRTREIIRNWQTRSPIAIHLIEVEQALPGRGRNLAIQRAQYPWLAIIDAGIIPDRDWIEQLVETATQHPQARVIFGCVRPAVPTYFTECAAIVYVPPGELRAPFIASTLLHRSAWEAVGGFREDLRSAEDLLFFKALDNAGVIRATSQKAIVTWELATTARATYRRFSTYSQHSMKANLASEWQVAVARFYFILLSLIVLGLVVFPWGLGLAAGLLLLRSERRIYRWYQFAPARQRWREMLNPRRVLMVLGINTLIDLAMFEGVWRWWRTAAASSSPDGAGQTGRSANPPVG
jgi:glycosyltransferase involved in cell wall biosynthesis